MEQQPYCAGEQIRNEKKTCHDTFKLTTRPYCKGSMVSLKDGFTV